jgi:hypothetical protein
MKSSRFQYEYRENASKLHRAVGDALRKPGGCFSRFKIYQEYPVNKINKNYPNGRHKFDWVVLDLALVIECHGEQHYQDVCFGGISLEEAHHRRMEATERDNTKQIAALEVGFTYMVVPYWEWKKVDDSYLYMMYSSNCDDGSVTTSHTYPPDHTEYREKQLERAREYRRQRYRRQKEWADKHVKR